MVASTGYGEKAGESNAHPRCGIFLETVPAYSSAPVEPIDVAVFHHSNEYWVSYYGGRSLISDFVFVPDTICEANLTHIKELIAMASYTP